MRDTARLLLAVLYLLGAATVIFAVYYAAWRWVLPWLFVVAIGAGVLLALALLGKLLWFGLRRLNHPAR